MRFSVFAATQINTIEVDKVIRECTFTKVFSTSIVYSICVAITYYHKQNEK